jgi:maleylpyruvate isomerase
MTTNDEHEQRPAHEPDPAIRRWNQLGEQTFAGTLAATEDAALDEPSLLPGWTRRTVVAHVVGNADGLHNLLSWARTGIETPMYASPDARQRDIETTAQLPPGALRAAYCRSADRLAQAVSTLPHTAWSSMVKTAQGRVVPATEVLWMRTRESWVHAADLVGTGAILPPPELLAALADDVLSGWARRGVVPDLELVASDTGHVWNHGASSTASGTLADIVWWITGRATEADLRLAGPAQTPPPWL